MTVIEINKRLWPFPEKWNELTPRQARAVMKAMCKNYNLDQAKLYFIKILSGCGWWNYCKHTIRKMGITSLYDQLHLCDFVFQSPRLTNNPLPVYRGYHGPASNFENLRMNEFAFAQNYYEAYQQNEDISALEGLIATIYRPRVQGAGIYSTVQGFNPDDPRELFTEAGMKARLNVVKRWPTYIKELIFLWYSGCLQQMMDDNADVFTGSDSEPALHGIVSVMRNVAKEGTYGDFEKVELMYVKMLMLELKESKHEAAQLEKANK